PYDKELLVQLDGNDIAKLADDIVANIFQGNTTVYWGITAATGRKMNYHDICIKKLTFAEAKVD
ncbi:MAG: lectin, partial [Bacteroidota bacterium]